MEKMVAVALVVCGTLLVALPIINDMFGVALVSKTMMALEGSANIRSNSSPYQQYLIMLVGAVMIFAGARGGRVWTDKG